MAKGKTVPLADGYKTLEDAAASEDWGTLLAILLAQPDADTAIDQMHRVSNLIVDHARVIRFREEARATLCA
jgi:hypothetical protein